MILLELLCDANQVPGNLAKETRLSPDKHQNGPAIVHKGTEYFGLNRGGDSEQVKQSA